ncbi:hypothetical protein RJT17_35255 [Streptomyces sp. P5-A9]
MKRTLCEPIGVRPRWMPVIVTRASLSTGTGPVGGQYSPRLFV